MAPKSGSLDEANNGGQSDCRNIIDLSSGESEGGLGSRPHVPRTRHISVMEPPTVVIVEQPAEEFRFRYPRESRTNGSIPGIRNSAGNKTYPAIRIDNYVGPVMVYVTCVSKDAPYRPHPHKLVGKKNCSGGVFTVAANITQEKRVVQLKNVGVQCVKRSKITAALLERKEVTPWHVGDPFKTGFDLTTDAAIGIHHVRLGIQALVPDADGRCRIPLRPVASDVITDRLNKLKVVYCSPRTGSVHGGTDIVLLTEKLPNQPLTVRFLEPSTGWCSEVKPDYVHKMTSLVVKTPPYLDPNTPCPVHVSVQLCRAPTGDPVLDKHVTSHPVPFQYTPDSAAAAHTAPKRPRIAKKELHKSLLPLKNCLQTKEMTPSLDRQFGSEKWMDSMPGRSSLNFDLELKKFKEDSELDRILMETQERAVPTQPPANGHNMFPVAQPSQMGQTTSNVPTSTSGQLSQMGQLRSVRHSTQNGPISIPQYTPAQQNTKNGPFLSRLNSRMRQIIPSDQISTNGQFLLTEQLYPAGPPDCINRQPIPNGPISIGQHPQRVPPPTVRHITPNVRIATIGQSSLMGHSVPTGQSPLMGHSIPNGLSPLMGHSIPNGLSPLMGHSVPNEQYSTIDIPPSFRNRQISQTSQFSPAESFSMEPHMGDMERVSPIEYDMSPQLPNECSYDHWGEHSPVLNQLSLDQSPGTGYGAQRRSTFPEIDAPMCRDGPMEQYFSPEPQQDQMITEPGPGSAGVCGADDEPEILRLELDSDIEALMNGIRELTTSERLKIAELIDKNTQ